MRKISKVLLTAIILLALVSPVQASSTVTHLGGHIFGSNLKWGTFEHDITNVIEVRDVASSPEKLASYLLESDYMTKETMYIDKKQYNYREIEEMVSQAKEGMVKEYTVEVGASITLIAPQVEMAWSMPVELDHSYDVLYYNYQEYINDLRPKPLTVQPDKNWMYAAGTKLTVNSPGKFVVLGVDGGLHGEQGPDIYYVNVVAAQAPAPDIVTAQPTSSQIVVNGKSMVFEAYNISDNNYFKLRDFAQAVNGTNNNFEVTWDGSKNAINLLSKSPYTVVGGELALGDGIAKTGHKTTSSIYKDGSIITPLGYNINDNNFFKLRDIARIFDIGVTWNQAMQTIEIDNSISYTE